MKCGKPSKISEEMHEYMEKGRVAVKGGLVLFYNKYIIECTECGVLFPDPDPEDATLRIGKGDALAIATEILNAFKGELSGNEEQFISTVQDILTKPRPIYPESTTTISN
jgi:hypothetical protein